MAAESGDFRPAASWEVLHLRARLLRRIRRFFEDRGFLEVETPLLSADTVIDRYLDPIPVTLFAAPQQMTEGPRRWLQTSPEFAMKRLLAAGAPSIYQITRAFRGGEVGRLHNPEFTIVEWYGVEDDMRQGMQLLSDLAELLFQQGAAERISYAAAFERWVGIDPHAADGPKLAVVVERQGIAVPDSLPMEDRDGWLDLLLVECIEPHLGFESPVILYDYPATQAALARLRGDRTPVAERFELYFRGIELANGYHELMDPEELRCRNQQINRLRHTDGKPLLPESSRLLAAMEHGLPPCTGVALGFDRSVMLVCGANELSEVIAFPSEIA